MAGIFGDPNDGGGERAYAPYYDLQDGNGERQPAAVYVNLQDGNGEQLVWQAKTMVDGYEDGDLAEYTSAGEATVDTTAAYEDTYGMHIAPAGETGMIYCEPNNSTAPLGEWLPSGSTFEYFLNMQAVNLIFFFAVAQANTYYQYEIRTLSGELSLYADNNGSHTQIAADTTVTWPTNEWLRFEVGYDTDGAGAMHVIAEDSTGSQLSKISGTATYHSDGSWLAEADHKGWAYYSYGNEHYYDSLGKI